MFVYDHGLYLFITPQIVDGSDKLVAKVYFC